MAKEVVYKVKIVGEGGEVVEKTAKNITELNKGVKDLESELEKTELGSDKFKELSKALKNNKDELDKAKTSAMGLGEKLQAVPGPIGQVAQGIKGLSTAFKALIANPVGLVLAAIAVALTTLYKAFTSTKAGAEKLEQVMAGVSAAMDVLRDRVLKVGGAIVKFFSGDFSGALEDAKGAVSGIGDEIASEFNTAMKLKKELQSIDDATRELNKSRAKQNLLIADAKLKINDENLSIEERRKALEQVRNAEVKLAKQEELLAKRRYEAIKAQNALSDSSKEALDAEAEAYNKMLQAQLDSKNKQKELFDQEKALRDKARADAKAAADERKRQVEEAAKFEQDLNLSLIQSAYDKAVRQAEIEEEAALKTINTLKVTEEKKAELRLKVEEQTALKLKAAQEARDKEDEAKRKEAEDKLKADADKIYQTKVKSNDALIALDAMKYETEQALTQEDIDKTIALMRTKTDLILQNDQLTAEERLLIEAQYVKGVAILQKQLTDSNVKLSQMRVQQDIDELNSLAQGAENLSVIFGAETEAGKMASIAAAQLNTFAGVTKALNDETIPNTFLRILAAGAVLANGIAQINKIMAVDTSVPKTSVPKMASGGIVGGQGTGTMDNIPVMLSPGESVINARSTSMFSPLLSAVNEMGGGNSFGGGIVSTGVDTTQVELVNSIRGNNQKPVEAFVVSTDITNRQMLDRQIKTRSLI